MRLAFVGLVALGTSGCVNVSPTRVELTAKVTDVSLSVMQGSLVTSLAGTFDLVLSVGDLVSGSSTITEPPTFTLVSTKDHGTLINLDAVLSGNTFPVTIDHGTSVTLDFSLSDQNTLASGEEATLCADGVGVAATVKDSENGDAPISVYSTNATLSGCP